MIVLLLAVPWPWTLKRRKASNYKACGRRWLVVKEVYLGPLKLVFPPAMEPCPS